MSRSTEVGIVYPASDLRPGRAQSAELKFGIAGSVATITLPVGALGVALYPRANDIRFALDAVPEPVPVVENVEQVSNVVLAPGAIAKNNEWTRRSLPADDREHILYLRNETGSTTVDVEIW